MTSSIADRLHISEGFVVWAIGRTVEETSLLDPLPEGAEVVEERDDDDPESVDAAILFVDARPELVDQLDDVLPRLGSIPLVWISWPAGADLDGAAVGDLVNDYGWHAVDETTLDETWSAVRLQQT